MAYASFNGLNKIWHARHISRKTKTRLFKTQVVLSVLLYGCETWNTTNGKEKKLDIFQTKSLLIFRIRWQQHLLNKEVLEMAGTDPISGKVRRKRWC